MSGCIRVSGSTKPFGTGPDLLEAFGDSSRQPGIQAAMLERSTGGDDDALV